MASPTLRPWREGSAQSRYEPIWLHRRDSAMVRRSALLTRRSYQMAGAGPAVGGPPASFPGPIAPRVHQVRDPDRNIRCPCQVAQACLTVAWRKTIFAGHAAVHGWPTPRSHVRARGLELE